MRCWIKIMQQVPSIFGWQDSRVGQKHSVQIPLRAHYFDKVHSEELVSLWMKWTVCSSSFTDRIQMPFHRASVSHVLCAPVLNADAYSYILRTRCMRQRAVCARRKITLHIDSRFSWKSPSNKWFVIDWQFRMYIKENQSRSDKYSVAIYVFLQ